MYIDYVRVSSRFQRSVKIDSDIGDRDLLASYICPRSSLDVLNIMAEGYESSKECAFTWTGPYGSGKSSLVLMLNALLSKNPKIRALAEESIPADDAKQIQKSFNISGKRGWSFLPIVGEKNSAEAAMLKSLVAKYPDIKKSSKETVLDFISKVARSEENGLFIVVDEMGKFLEASAEGVFDVYFFQQLAELASRSEGKIVVLGILHQAFAEYSRRLGRDMRDEWSKIQGRYVDMPLNVAGEELIDIIGRAITSNEKPNKPNVVSKSVAKHISEWRPVNSDLLAESLNSCWPLHAATAALLGPVSRRRFGQNQRSVFGFLNSSEPNGFQDFLKNTDFDPETLFTPAMLWGYLKANLEPSIMASPDGHRWSLALDALARAEATDGGVDAQNVIKTIAMMDMFHERSGLVAGKKLLLKCLPNLQAKDLDQILSDLENSSILLYKKHKRAFSLYEGSDFDIEEALDNAHENIAEVDFDQIRKASRFQPIVAKKHYHKTGALRWMNVDLVPASSAIKKSKEFHPTSGAMGLFMVVLCENDNEQKKVENLCAKSSETNQQWPIVSCIAKNSTLIVSLAQEVQALEWIKTNNPALGGDTVARREVDSRLASVKSRLEECLTETLVGSSWYSGGKIIGEMDYSGLHSLTSQKADELYNQSPRINSELANRIKPSSNSNSALKILLKAMIQKQGQERLGIQGFPAEGGLFQTLLDNTGLYNSVGFRLPEKSKDIARLIPLWKATDKFFKDKNKAVSLPDLYDLWAKPPYGIKEGLLPFFAISYICTRNHDYAVYLEGVYRPSIDDLFIDYLMKSPKDIALRPMNFSDVGQKILAGVCDVLNELEPESVQLSETSEPLDIARRLVSIVVGLPTWVMRTQQISKNSLRLRELIKNANDPNKVLFDDLPELFKEHEESLQKGDVQPIVDELKISLKELVNAYPKLIQELKDTLQGELQVELDTEGCFSEIRNRATNIMHVSGDFTLDAFAARLSNYKGDTADIEGIASLAGGKPSRDWIDLDVNRAKLRIAELAHKFNHTEAYGRIQNREDLRQAVAFMVGVNGKPKTYVHEFTIKKSAQKEITALENQIKDALNGHMQEGSEILLAALANIGAEILEREDDKREVA